MQAKNARISYRRLSPRDVARGFLIGPGYYISKKAESTFATMVRARREVCHDATIGLLRILRLFFAHIQWANPFNWLCVLLDLVHPILSRLFTDLYVLAKLGIPILLLSTVTPTWLLSGIAWYIIVETMVYLYTQIIVTTSLSGPESSVRTFLLILIDYVAVNLSFAYIYYSGHLIKGLDYPAKAIYFSIVAGTTTGFGDIVPTCKAGYEIVIVHLLTTLSFLVAFFAYFLPSIKTRKGRMARAFNPISTRSSTRKGGA